MTERLIVQQVAPLQHEPSRSARKDLQMNIVYLNDQLLYWEGVASSADLAAKLLIDTNKIYVFPQTGVFALHCRFRDFNRTKGRTWTE